MRDPRTEAFLDRGQWQWTYDPNVTFDQIDISYSADNPARLNRRIDDERVLQYAEEMQSGVEFPAIILMTPSDRGEALYDVATGMHRLNAADTAQSKAPKHIDAYVVTEPDKYRREFLTRSANTIEGRGVSLQEQIMHIIHLHEQFNVSIPTLCKEWHVKEHTVRTHLRAEQARKRARDTAGIDLTATKLSLTAQGQLNSSIHSDRVFSEAVKFIYNYKPSMSAVDDICKAIKETREEAQALQVVAEYVEGQKQRQEKEKARTARTRTGPAQSMISNAARFNKQVSAGIDQLFLSSLTGPDKQKARTVIDDMVFNANRILGELDRIEQINARAKLLVAV